MNINEAFIWNGDDYRFIRIEQSGRVKAVHVETGMRVSLPANSFKRS